MRSFSIGYSFISIYMPLAVLSAMVFLLRGFIPFSPAPLLVNGVLGALAASLYCDFMMKTYTSRSAADIRGLVIILALAYVFSSLLRRGISWDKRFLPDLSTILALVGTFYVWVGVLSLKQFFSLRGRFESYTEMYQGGRLHKALFDDLDLLQTIEREISRIRQNYLIQLAIVGIVLTINTAYKVSMPLILYLFLAAILAGGICIYGFFGVMRREHHCAAEGLTLSSFDRTKHILGIGVFSVLSIVVAVVLSSDKSLFPFSVIVGFLDLLFKLFHLIMGLFIMLWGLLWHLLSGLFPETTDPEPLDPNSLPDILSETEAGGPSPFWTWFKYGLIIIAVVVFIRFMISPLLNRGKGSGKMTFRRKLRHIVAEWFRGVPTGLFSFLAFIRNRGTAQKLRRRKPDAEEIHRAAASVMGAYSPAKKREVRQSATLFARLIVWGGEYRQVAWKPAHAPGEYCSLLTASPTVPEVAEASPESARKQNEGILRCGEIFEKALYSAQVLSEAERDEFKYLVEEVTSFADN